MTNRTTVATLQVTDTLLSLVNNEILPGTEVTEDQFWSGFAALNEQFGKRNQTLLEQRDTIQAKIDQWHKTHPSPFNAEIYQTFLTEIGYIVPVPEKVEVNPTNVDPEIATIAGPQLVVPLMNARYALNAANARWGSLYDALYGTDAIGEADGCERGSEYNPRRGAAVVLWAANFLNEAIPLQYGQHQDVVAISPSEGVLTFTLSSGEKTQLSNPSAWIGYSGEIHHPTGLLFKHNDLHLELQFDPNDAIGRTHPAGLKDIILESAVTTIQDCEDSVAAVDSDDKVLIYRNWLGLCKGTLSDTFEKNGTTMTRMLNPEKHWSALDGSDFSLPGRSLMLIRNVGLLMKTDAVLDADHQPIFEGLMDSLITTTIAMHDLKGKGKFQNSRHGSVYIVKPKMHGPDEVKFTTQVFSKVETILGLAPNTIKLGIMDEERRTTVNLKACIDQAKERVIFINTGFLDRTGDEIHTNMEAGPVVPKSEMKGQTWIQAYENWNVDVGLSCGFREKAQIGKGMWAMPDLMADMLANKHNHLEAGANCAWVPSPTAATLHAVHYHRVNVLNAQLELLSREHAALNDILTPPLLSPQIELSAETIQREIENSAQGILGYVVRWINQGIGCSKVPNIDNVGLMEDRATLRISSQHIANWLYHGVVSESQVMSTLQRMAEIVDTQNANDPVYQSMAPHFENSVAFQAACELVFRGRQQPNGYTEPVLHARRLEYKRNH